MNIVLRRIFIISFTLILGLNKVSSQTNIARNSIASHSGGGQTIFGYGPDKYNDGVKTQGSGIFGWVSTTGNPCTNGCWIQFDWTTSQVMGRLVIFNESSTNRTLNGGTIQYWNGSSWVNSKTFLGSPSMNLSIDFTPVSTKSLRISFINTSGTQNTNPAVNEIEIYNTYNYDAGIKSFEYVCCNGTQPVYATLSNFGAKTMDSVWITWQLDGITQNSFQLKKKIGPSKDTLLFLGNANFNGNTSYNFKAWTSKPNNKTDSVAANDTSVKKNFVFKKPSKPSVFDQSMCGCGFPILKGKGDLNTSIFWSNANDPDLILFQGDSSKDKNKFCPPATIRYSASSLNGKSDSFKQSLTQTWSITGGTANYDKGIYFDLKPSQNIFLEKILQSITDNGNSIINTYNVEVYYKKGTYVGSENNKNNWKLIGTSSIQNTNLISGGLAQKVVPLNFSTIRLKKDTLYSICINVVNADQWLRLNAVNSGTTNVEYKNDFVKMYSGALFLNSWGSKTMFPGFVPENWMVYKFGCISDSIHQLTKLKPTPGGTELKKGQIFQSNFPNTTGTISDPDIVAAYDTFSYVFNPPNGFFNTGYASKWTISKIVLRTRTGKIVPKGWTYVLPFSGNDGVVFLVLDSQWIDTPLVLNLFLRDLGPYFCDTLLTRYIFLTMRPKLSFKANPAAICDGDAVLFENSSTISSGYIKYFWDFGTGNPADTSNAVSPVFKFPKYGTYYVKLKGTSVPYGYVSTKTVKVIVNEIPNVKFDRTNACEGQDVVLTNKTTMSTPQTITYLWDLGDGVRKTTKDVLYRYAKTGGYLVALTATSNGCSNTSFKNVYQFSKPNASFLVSGTLFCSLRDVVFLNISTINSGIAGSNWIFGDGDISTDDNPLHSFKSEGDFNVKLIMVSEFGCKDSFSKKLKINEIPKADFTNLQPCDQKPTTFNNKTIYSPLNLPNYKWDFGDTTSSTQTNPMKFWNTLGPKIVRLSAYSFNGCADSITKKLTIIPQPTVDFDIFDQCSGKNVQINNKTFIKQGNLVYEWKFGDGRTSNDRIPGLQYNISSTITFNVSLKSYVNIGCSDSVTKSVTISENPNCSFIAEREWTLGNRGMKFKPANTSYSSYFWQFGDGGSSSTTSPKYKYLYDFDFPVTLTIKNSAGCDCKLTKNVKVDAKTGLFTQENERLNIFTDHNSLYIDAHKNSYKNGILQLTDMQGTKVFLESFKVLKGKNSINLSHLSSGIYNVQFTSGDFSQIAKIIIP